VAARDPAFWQTIAPYLDQALELSATERPAWLADLRKRIPDIAHEIEGLLADRDALSRQQFLEHPSPGLPRRGLAGKQVAAYTLIEPLGEGGMGSVWLAERSDGVFQQKVAVKLLRGGAHHATWHERFLKERQLLASLQHPSIVHVIDAGRTDDDEPFLVMEFVRGEPIDAYAARQSIADRLSLFLKVCEGVSHAHSRLVIHRDLKPSNILVDQSGQPKLLDFGIAKLLDEGGDSTRTLERVMTPSYASPEQFHGGTQTTATDVYSLGAVLYRLLTGRTPYDLTRRSSTDPAASPQFGVVVDATRLNAALTADVDYILRKALRVEPEERYVSVEALGNDVRALLESRPVEARAGDAWYRGRKFVTRYRVPVTATLLGVASLSVGLVAANRQRRIAEHRFRQVRKIANEFIALDADIRALPGSTTARQRIVSESLKYLEEVGAETHGDLELTLEIANAHLQVASVQGVPFVANLGEYAAAENSLRTAASLVRVVLRGGPRNGRAWFTASLIHRALMAVLDYQDRRDEALKHAGRASRCLEQFLKYTRPTAEDINTVTHIYLTVATAFNNSNRFGDAIHYARRAANIAEGVDAARMRHASALGVLSVSLRRTGDLDGALDAARQSRALLEGLVAGGGTDARHNLALAWYREGLVLDDDGGIGLGRSAEAAVAFRRGVEIARELAKDDPNDSRCRVSMANSARQLGDILMHQDVNAALAVYDAALGELRESANSAREYRERILLLAHSSYPLRALRGERDAQDRLDQAFRLLSAIGRYPSGAIEPDSETFRTVRAQADHYAESDRLPEAIQTYRELLNAVSAWPLKMAEDLRDAVALAAVLRSLSQLLERAGQGREARELLSRRAALWAPWLERQPGSPFVRGQARLS